MADRKETPDVLAEILGEIPQPDVAPAAPSTRPAPLTLRRQPEAPAIEPPPRRSTAPKATRWEYLIVSFQNYHGWRPRFCNGVQIPSWDEAPLMHEYLQQLGTEGWEMAGASAGSTLYGSADYHQVYFKRRTA